MTNFDENYLPTKSTFMYMVTSELFSEGKEWEDLDPQYQKLVEECVEEVLNRAFPYYFIRTLTDVIKASGSHVALIMFRNMIEAMDKKIDLTPCCPKCGVKLVLKADPFHGEKELGEDFHPDRSFFWLCPDENDHFIAEYIFREDGQTEWIDQDSLNPQNLNR